MAIERAQANGIELAYETFGERSDPPLFLVMGLGAQMIAWPEDFCHELAGRGLFVVRFDNRDVGESQWLDDAGVPDLQACFAGDTSSAPYDLAEMARDVVGLIDALGFDSVHLAGASLGGMIAQTAAIQFPERLRSLISIMSTSGERSVSQPTPEAQAVLTRAPARTREESIENTVQAAHVIGSTELGIDDDLVRERAGRSWDRGYNPAGVARQLGAIYRSGNRTEGLRGVRLPALVIHGEADPLIPVAGGRATAAAIEGAELVTIPGMGHDFPRAAWERITGAIAALVERVERERAGAGAAA